MTIEWLSPHAVGPGPLYLQALFTSQTTDHAACEVTVMHLIGCAYNAQHMPADVFLLKTGLGERARTKHTHNHSRHGWAPCYLKPTCALVDVLEVGGLAAWENLVMLGHTVHGQIWAQLERLHACMYMVTIRAAEGADMMLHMSQQQEPAARLTDVSIRQYEICYAMLYPSMRCNDPSQTHDCLQTYAHTCKSAVHEAVMHALEMLCTHKG